MTGIDISNKRLSNAINTSNKITLSVFTDPMMGISYEHEPVLHKLRNYFKRQIEIRYIMAGLVRDVSDFMLPEEKSMNPEDGIHAYNKRLARIYLQEESIGGLPMNMEDFHLFDPDHRSSYPLNIAYEAVKILQPELSERFLYMLREATIVSGIPTTHTAELVKLAVAAGMDGEKFLECFQNGDAEEAFYQDLRMAALYRIQSLPAYLIGYRGKSAIVSGLPDYENFKDFILQIQSSHT